MQNDIKLAKTFHITLTLVLAKFKFGQLYFKHRQKTGQTKMPALNHKPKRVFVNNNFSSPLYSQR